MRTTVAIDDDVFEAVRAQAEASGRRPGEVLWQIRATAIFAAIPETAPALPQGPGPDFNARQETCRTDMVSICRK